MIRVRASLRDALMLGRFQALKGLATITWSLRDQDRCIWIGPNGGTFNRAMRTRMIPLLGGPHAEPETNWDDAANPPTNRLDRVSIPDRVAVGRRDAARRSILSL